jgi:hypothetical protein
MTAQACPILYILARHINYLIIKQTANMAVLLSGSVEKIFSEKL